jgi:hypothetical protein
MLELGRNVVRVLDRAAEDDGQFSWRACLIGGHRVPGNGWVIHDVREFFVDKLTCTRVNALGVDARGGENFERCQVAKLGKVSHGWTPNKNVEDIA